MLPLDPATRAAQLVDRIAELERVKAAAAAEQAHAAVLLDRARREEEAANGVPRRRQGAGVATEIALARQDSPARGSRHLGFAKALVNEMPHTLAALECGALSEWRATILVRETAYLALEDRQKIDVEMCAETSRLRGLGDARLAAEAKRLAYRLDAQAVVRRARRAESERRVSLRPAPDTMTYLTALLPVKQGVAVYAALKRTADASMDPVRGQGQIMADTLVERVTGVPGAAAVPVGVNITVSDEALLGGGDEPATIAGYGPVPAAVARRLISEAVSAEAKVLVRRLYRRCATGALVKAESRSRLFPRGLAELIDLRDQTAGRRTAMPQSGTMTMWWAVCAEVRRPSTTGKASASDAITSRRRRAGTWLRCPAPIGIPSSSPRRREPPIARRHRHCPE